MNFKTDSRLPANAHFHDGRVCLTSRELVIEKVDTNSYAVRSYEGDKVCMESPAESV